MSSSILQQNRGHEFYMGCALDQARRAQAFQEVPVGAVGVDQDGKIIGQGCNFVECYRSQNYHAEVLAIKQASLVRGDWRLAGCWLYVTLEPCLMCLGLIALSRIEGIVYGAGSQKFGEIKMLQ